MTTPNPPRPPAVEPVQRHDRVLDAGRLPQGPSDLNYRPAAEPSANNPWGVVSLTLSATLSAAVATAVTKITLLTAGTVTPLLVAAAAVVAVVGWWSLLDDRRALAWLAAPLTAATLLMTGPGCTGLLAWLVIAAPAAARLADRLAAHALFWRTAHHRVDLATLRKWRDAWSRRFDWDRSPLPMRAGGFADRRAFQGVVETLRRYPEQAAWAAGPPTAAMLLAIAVMLLSQSPTSPLAATGLVVAALAGAAVLRAWERPGAWRETFWLLTHLLEHPDSREPNPSVWQSPAGPRAERARLAWSALAAAGCCLLLAAWGVAAGWADATPAPLVPAASNQLGWGGVARWLGGLVAMLVATGVVAVGAAASETHPEWTELDGYSDRLRHSRNRHERRCVFKGVDSEGGQPVLVDRTLFFEHQHVIGPTGSGKTALALTSDLIQLIRARDGAVVIFDGKGDQALFNAARHEAAAAGATFKHFTNLPYRSTHLFDVFDQRVLEQMTVVQVLGKILSSLNLHHGADYARAFYSLVIRKRLSDALLLTVPQRNREARFTTVKNFRDLADIVEFLSQAHEGRDDAAHLAMLLESLAQFEQLNLSPDRTPADPVWRNAIRMSEALRERQVVYFYLVGATDAAAVGQIGRLALYELLTAAVAQQQATGRRLPSYFIADEAQTLIGQNIENVLAQCRGYGVSCTLAHQSISQLAPPGGADLRQTVMNCTAVKQVFAARDPWLANYITEMSGRTLYYSSSYDVTARDAQGRNVGLHAVKPDREGTHRVGVREYIGPRITAQRLRDIGRDPNQSVAFIERGEGVTQYLDGFAMRTPWPVAQATYKRRSAAPWPAGDEDTFTLTSDWPAPTEGTFVPTTHPAVGDGADSDEIQKLKRLLEEQDPDRGR